jgi:hypothetical protein
MAFARLHLGELGLPVLRFITRDTAERINNPALTAKPAEIGRSRRFVQPPFDMISDWRKLISKVGAMTRPSTSGAGSKSNLRSRYQPPHTSMSDVDDRVVHP